MVRLKFATHAAIKASESFHPNLSLRDSEKLDYNALLLSPFN